MSRMAELSNRFYNSIRSKEALRAAEGETVNGFAHIAGKEYAVVVTFRKNGEPMPTPVWFGVDAQGRLYFRTDPESPKVNRIRNNPEVRVAPCTSRGKPTGPAARGRARLLSKEEVPHAEETIQAEYGRFRKIYEAGTDRFLEAQYVEVTPA